MKITELLSPERIVVDANVTSKKRTLELLGNLLAGVDAELGELDIYNGLLARERLGSTGLGHGVAIPHGRFKHISTACGALLRFAEPIDFDSIDGEPVDLVFALMVPEESTEEHLQLLATLAELFGDREVCQALRQASGVAEIVAILDHWTPSEDLSSSASA